MKVAFKLMVLILLSGAALLIYAGSWGGPFYFDDGHLIVNNDKAHSWGKTAILLMNLKPRSLPILTFALNYRFGGLDTFGYHVVNIGIHFINGLLVYWLTLLLLSNPVISGGGREGWREWLSLGAALVFVSHPVQTQAVTYIVQRLTSMATMFYLLAACLYIKGRYVHTSGEGKGYLWFYLGSLISGLGAFLSKEISFTLPLMLLLSEFFFIRRDGKINRKLIVSGLAVVAGAVILGLIFKLAPTRETNDISRWQYFITQFRVISTYIRLLLVPINQNLDYDFRLSQSLWEAKTLLGGIFLLGLLSIGVWLYRKYRLISFGVFWFFLTLSVESSIIPIRDVIFEHRMYLPLVGYVLVLAGVFYYLREKIKPRIAVIIWGALVLGLGASAYARNQIWRDDLLLWHDTVSKSPNKARPHLNRGNAYLDRGLYQKALEDYNRALEIDPGYAEAHYNSGLIYALRKDYALAKKEFIRAIEYKPDYISAYINLGNVCNDVGEYPAAIENYDKALAIDPLDANAYCNRGLAYFRIGDKATALADYDRCLDLDSSFSNGYLNRGIYYLSIGQAGPSLMDLDKYIRANGRSPQAYYQRARAHWLLGDSVSAGRDIGIYQKLTERQSDQWIK
jgi:tetratricopeptide (TPR) repeat protein